jgi:hypothetical protein
MGLWTEVEIFTGKRVHITTNPNKLLLSRGYCKLYNVTFYIHKTLIS